MCNCNNVDLGGYDNEVVLAVPDSVVLRVNSLEREIRDNVSIDKCIADEIQDLWRLGVCTTGCCCGHGKIKGYIGVEYRFIPLMFSLGYNPVIFEDDENRIDTFRPKTVFCPYCQENIAPSNSLDRACGWHDYDEFVHDENVDHPHFDLGIFKAPAKITEI